jgi:large subunit ribosomal protein L23
MALFKKKQKTEEKRETAPTETKSVSRHPRSAKTVLKQPWFSERATALSAQNKYLFLVDESATKPVVKDEIQRRYGVRVRDVNIINKAGKLKRFRYVATRRTGIKKAIVTLKAGDKIEIQ